MTDVALLAWPPDRNPSSTGAIQIGGVARRLPASRACRVDRAGLRRPGCGQPPPMSNC